MASDLLNVGRQSVLTAQRQLTTTGHNISNANTEGYNRQSVLQATNDPRQYGGQTFGMGVHVENVRRSWDQFAVNELNLTTTNFSNKLDTEESLDQITTMLSSVASKKIPENINEWFDSLKTLSDSPNDMGARKVLLEKSQIVAQNMNHFHSVVRLEKENINKKLEQAVERINSLAKEIRDVHRLMMRTPGPHNDFRDEHERLIKELAQYTKVTVTPRKNNEGFNVHIGNGHTIVSGTEASELTLLPGQPDAQQLRIGMVEGKGIKAIKHAGLDGKLASYLKARDESIPYVMDELGRLATAMSYQVNKLQSQGLDLRGDIGTSLFTDVNSKDMAKSRVIQMSESTAEVSVYIEDVSQLSSGEYEVKYDGSDYRIVKPNGDVITVSGSDFSNNFILDGMRISIQTPPKDGERFLIRPTESAAALMKVEMKDAAQLAAQSYESSYTEARGTAKFNILQAGSLREFQVVISPTGDQFAVLDMKGQVVMQPQAYPPSGPVTVNGTVFELTAGAKENDKFAANLVPSEGDNGNLLKMQNIQTEKVMNDGNSTVLEVYKDLNTEIGLRTATATRLADVAKLENEAAKERIASISGVNLDEEAANMMKFQQAYMASSRIMQSANDTFNTILALR
ncbi:Flagellar hook-associated protein [Vibrio nigripulchritudo SFn27]|uniref:Flagellar hook-associated protein 1 n=1 Tax=Vibrio nigripulchritudo TaxID=28173 RepID=U4K7W1_9VIBR|nr:flagellar hook-associated protein FlgK [Vibrio nigripulchritudo]CCN85116.1 Flagellar hook-associated protein [Vibrio nigripulchritudo BLFn1]CCN90328.1 Flagellar hook-associated protein [Vibrio nigripulchritudo SFn27]CCN94059.1 Flagellar hook-associated protein [Vibrio nigripulchritudo ENn2]CCO42412.1 Flagellar hook-associated protein [Vibrio nigripulchritudo SFn135]CCO51485.1 Flagellar hook-associated protein [Vibrio nigripulchritudo Wn13]